MRRQLFPALLVFVAMTVILGLVYPLVVLGIGQGLFHDQVNGSLVKRNGKVIGSSLLAQSFTKKEYFHPRPSAAGANGYDASASSASNLGPTNPVLIKTVKDRVAAYRKENALGSSAKVPVDAVTSSGSGLDPDISVANARLQARRVAEASGVSLKTVLGLVSSHTNDKQLGFLGEKTVNVLDLNLALDAAKTP